MRKGQFIGGIQLRFRSKEDVPILLAELAVGWNSRTTKSPKGKDSGLHLTKAVLFEFAGGLTLCICYDAIEKTRGVEAEVCLTIPYIIVDGNKIPVDDKYATEDDDGTGIDLLKEFVALHWGGNSEPIKAPAPRKKVVNLDSGKFPKMLIDLVGTLEAFHENGMSHDNLTNKQIPDYEMSVWLRQIAGNTLKDTEQFYEFLDNAREKSTSSPLNGMAFDDAVIALQSEKPAIYKFMSERSFFNNKEAA